MDELMKRPGCVITDEQKLIYAGMYVPIALGLVSFTAVWYLRGSLEAPTSIRRNQKTANDFVKAAENKNMEYLDIPAFLRRQAD